MINHQYHYFSKDVKEVRMDGSQSEEQSEVSFLQRQQDLRDLYREFRVALSEMKQLPSYSDFIEKDEIEEAFDVEDRQNVKTKYQLRSILRELKNLKSETREIQTILLIPRNPSERKMYQQLISKVGLIIQILNQHIQRTENLLIETE